MTAILLAGLLAQLPAARNDGPLTPAQERALGEALAKETRQRMKPYGDASVEAFVQGLGARLEPGVPDRRVEVRFEVVTGDSEREPVPVAVSGASGFVFVPVRAILTAQSEAELAAMLAHAVAHLGLRRPRVLPDHVETGKDTVLLPLALREAQRARELEADAAGLRLAAKAGFDARAWRHYVAREQADEQRMQSMLPEKELRLARLDEALAALPRVAGEDSDEFIRLQGVLRVRVSAARQRPSLQRR